MGEPDVQLIVVVGRPGLGRAGAAQVLGAAAGVGVPALGLARSRGVGGGAVGAENDVEHQGAGLGRHVDGDSWRCRRRRRPGSRGRRPRPGHARPAPAWQLALRVWLSAAPATPGVGSASSQISTAPLADAVWRPTNVSGWSSDGLPGSGFQVIEVTVVEVV